MKTFMLGPCGNISHGLQYPGVFCVRGRGGIQCDVLNWYFERKIFKFYSTLLCIISQSIELKIFCHDVYFFVLFCYSGV